MELDIQDVGPPKARKKTTAEREAARLYMQRYRATERVRAITREWDENLDRLSDEEFSQLERDCLEFRRVYRLMVETMHALGYQFSQSTNEPLPHHPDEAFRVVQDYAGKGLSEGYGSLFDRRDALAIVLGADLELGGGDEAFKKYGLALKLPAVLYHDFLDRVYQWAVVTDECDPQVMNEIKTLVNAGFVPPAGSYVATPATCSQALVGTWTQ